MKWLYGDSWDKYPIEEGELWRESHGSILSVCDIFNGLPDYMYHADMIYSDPPWNTGNLTSFFTKAEKSNTHNFNDLANKIFSFVRAMKEKTCYLEIGYQNLDIYLKEMQSIFPFVQYWQIKYYKKYPCYLVRGGISNIAIDYSGMDDSETPFVAMRLEECKSVADMCMGRGLTALAAYDNNKLFYGTELNKRRLAVAIDRICQRGEVFTHEIR